MMSTSTPPGRLTYDPAIDGLRALSVLAVMAYHAGFVWAAGGYLGVEVFFVISGFLVVALMAEERALTGAFSLAQFWLRRARRLLPAVIFLLVVVSIAVPLAWPDAAAPLPGQVASAAAYVANWQQLLTATSYFDAYSRPPILRHLWSLAVEEQFYVLYPVVFWWASRLLGERGVRAMTIVLTLGLTAVGLTVLLPRSLDRSYLGTDTRMIGILLGALLALWWRPWRAPAVPASAGPRLAWTIVACAAVVALLIAFGTLGLGPGDRPLGLFWRLRLVDAVTLVLIVATAWRTGLVSRVLGTGPLVAIGRRSYSLYLWHWPVFAVTRPELDVSATTALALRVVLTLGLAELSFRAIEAPFRTGALQRLVRGGLRTGERRWQLGAIVSALIVLPLTATGMLIAAGSAPPQLSPLQTKLEEVTTREHAAHDAPPPELPGYRDVTILGSNDTARSREVIAATLPGAAIDVRGNRDLTAATQQAVRMLAADQLRKVVVLEFAQNEAVNQAEVAALVAALPERTLLLVTPRGTDHYSTKLDYDGATRRAIAAVQAAQPRLHLIDTMAVLGGEPEVEINRPLSATAQREVAQALRSALAVLPPAARDLRARTLSFGAASGTPPTQAGRYGGVLLLGDSVLRNASGVLLEAARRRGRREDRPQGAAGGADHPSDGRRSARRADRAARGQQRQPAAERDRRHGAGRRQTEARVLHPAPAPRTRSTRQPAHSRGQQGRQAIRDLRLGRARRFTPGMVSGRRAHERRGRRALARPPARLHRQAAASTYALRLRTLPAALPGWSEERGAEAVI